MKDLMDDLGIVVSQGYMWRCVRCGKLDGTWADREMCEAAAAKHHDECES